jgi:hypothetical protein
MQAHALNGGAAPGSAGLTAEGAPDPALDTCPAPHQGDGRESGAFVYSRCACLAKSATLSL